jgi:hypothetical protein
MGRHALGSHFTGSDWYNLGLVHERGLSPALLTTPIFDHVVPGHRVADAAILASGPSWAVAAWVLVGLYGLTLLGFHALLRALCGRGRWTLGFTGLYAVSPLWVPHLTWWSAGVSNLAGTGATLWCLVAWVAFVRTRRVVLLAACLLALCAALLCFERAVLTPVYLVAVRVLLMDARPLRATLRRDGPALALLLLPVLAWGILYLSVGETDRAFPSPGTWLEYARISWLQGFAPALLGADVVAGERPSVSGAAVVLAQVVLAGLVALSLRYRGRAAWRGWTFFALPFAANLGLVGMARVAELGPALGFDARYFTDPLWLFWLGAAAAFALEPPTGRVDRARPAGHRPVRVLAAGLAAVVVVASSLTAAAQADRSPGHAARAWFERFERSVAAARAREPDPVRLLDADLPEYVVPGWLSPWNRASRVLRIAHPDLVFDRPGPVAYLSARGDVTRARLRSVPGGAPRYSDAVHGDPAALARRLRSGTLCAPRAGTVPLTVELALPARDRAQRPAALVLRGRADRPAGLPVYFDLGDGYPLVTAHEIAWDRDARGGLTHVPAGARAARIQLPAKSGICVRRVGVAALVA